MTIKIAERDPRESMLKAFRLFDYDSTGKITFVKLKKIFNDLGENMSNEEI